MLTILPNKHDQEYIKNMNRLLVLEMVRQHRPVSRAEVSKLTGMSATAIGRIVGDLIEGGWSGKRINLVRGRQAGDDAGHRHSLDLVGRRRGRPGRGEDRLDRSRRQYRRPAIPRAGPRFRAAGNHRRGDRGHDRRHGRRAGLGDVQAHRRRRRHAGRHGSGDGHGGLLRADGVDERNLRPDAGRGARPAGRAGQRSQGEGARRSGTAAMSGDGKTALISIGSGVGSAIVIEGKIYGEPTTSRARSVTPPSTRTANYANAANGAAFKRTSPTSRCCRKPVRSSRWPASRSWSR